jgi:uncharacterized protein YbjQ (UPF0145 family)
MDIERQGAGSRSEHGEKLLTMQAQKDSPARAFVQPRWRIKRVETYIEVKEPYSMLMTTTTVVEGKPVSRYLGVVTGEAIIGANVFRDLLASVRDVVGGRSATYEKGLAEARTVAMKEMEQRASELGANAVIGIDLDYEVMGQNNGMLMVSVSGTAVVC